MRIILGLLLIAGMVGCDASIPVDAPSATSRSANIIANAPLRAASGSARRKRPNVVVLLADDLGSRDIDLTPSRCTSGNERITRI